MKLQYLKYFCVLAEELHFGRAANRLAISQPPLSAAIKALEDELGAQLFLRNSKMVQLTMAGAAFLVEAREILERLSRVGGVVRSMGDGLKGRVDVGMTASMLYRELPVVLDACRRHMPTVEVVLHELPTAEQVDQLLRRQLHAAFIQGSTLTAQLKSVPLKNDEFVACLPQHHPLAGQRSVNLRELADEDFVMFSRLTSPTNHDNVIAVFSRAGIHPRTVHSVRNWLTIVAMVAAGCGVALAPATLARAGVQGVRFVPIGGASASAPALLAWNPGFMSPPLQEFLDVATRALRSRTARPGTRPARAP